MNAIPLTIHDVTAAPIVLGTWALGGGNDWGDTSDTDARQTLATALESGMNLIDTAPIYGAGLAEERIGQFLKGNRSRVLLASKCGITLKGGRPDHDLRPESIVASCESSLRRLQTDYIDLYQIHWPDPKVPLAESMGALVRLQEQGKICAIGLCNFSREQVEAACALAPVAAVQARLSLLDRENQTLAGFCHERQISFWAYGALGGGILSGKYKKMPNLRKCDARRYFYKHYFGEGFTQAMQVALRVQQMARQKQVPACAVALAAIRQLCGVSGVLAGARTAQQVKENSCAQTLRLTPQEQAFLWS